MSKPLLIPKLPPGHRIREYEILMPIFEGGQGRVYIGRLWREGQPPAEQMPRLLKQRLTPERVAAYHLCVIKIPHPASIDNLRDEHTFLSNPGILHPRVIQLFKIPPDISPQRGRRPGLCFDTFKDDEGGLQENYPCLILNYEAGGSVRDLMRRYGDEALPTGVAVLIARQVAEALHHLHTVAEIVHHDIAPTNVLLRRPLGWPIPTMPECVVVDFAAADSTRYTRNREQLGQPRYRPPERHGGPTPKGIDTPPDIYSLGVMFYELLAGRAAVPTGRVTDEFNRTRSVPLSQLQEKAPHLSEPLCALVMAMIDPVPANRPTAAEVIARLDEVPERNLPAKLRGPRPPNIMRQIGTAAATLVVLCVVLVGAMGFGWGTPAPQPTNTPTPVRVTVTPLPSLTVAPTAVTTSPPTSTPAVAAPKP
ncbi:protein kinase [Chloroflexales bacterium ZM16-3]|nr:protein kinase [Chloroflexales bacterium ZM16-3]